MFYIINLLCILTLCIIMYRYYTRVLYNFNYGYGLEANKTEDDKIISAIHFAAFVCSSVTIQIVSSCIIVIAALAFYKYIEKLNIKTYKDDIGMLGFYIAELKEMRWYLFLASVFYFGIVIICDFILI